MRRKNIFLKNKKVSIIMIAVLALGVAGTTKLITKAANPSVKYTGERIAISADGNAHDKDDWGATPVTLAIIAKKGYKENLVHYDYNSHLWGSSSGWDKEMTKSVDGSINYFAYNKNVFYNNVTSQSQSIANLASEIEKSTKTDPLYVILAGPAEVLYQATQKATKGQEYVYVISHSEWNNSNQAKDHPNQCHKLSDIKKVNIIQISDQNSGLNTSQKYSDWDWMKTSSDKGLNFLYQRMLDEKKADISDAGMVYFLLMNDENGNSAKLKNLLMGSSTQNTAKPNVTVSPTTGSNSLESIKIEAENYKYSKDIKVLSCNDGGKKVGYINNGDYTGYDNVNFNNISSITFRVSSDKSGGTIKVRTKSTTGTVIATAKINKTNGWQTYKEVTATVSKTTGIDKLYLTFEGTTGYLFDIDSFKLVKNTSSNSTVKPSNTINPVVTVKPVTPTANPVVNNSTGAFVEEYGKVVMEVESVHPTDDWKFYNSNTGFTGKGYFIWEGSNNYGKPNEGKLEYKVIISNPGTYTLKIRSNRDVSDDQQNDCFVQVDNHEARKIYASHSKKWAFTDKLDEPKEPAIYNLSQGEHKITIYGRSEKFYIDRIHLFKSGVSGIDDANQPESKRNK